MSLLKSFKIHKYLKNANYLELTPIQRCKSTANETGQITLLVPRFQSSFLLKMMPKNRDKHIHIKLDELGSETWQLIDGQQNVNLICEKLVDKFGEKLKKPAEQVTQFLTILYQRKLVTFKEIEEIKQK